MNNKPMDRAYFLKMLEEERAKSGTPRSRYNISPSLAQMFGRSCQCNGCGIEGSKFRPPYYRLDSNRQLRRVQG